MCAAVHMEGRGTGLKALCPSTSWVPGQTRDIRLGGKSFTCCAISPDPALLLRSFNGANHFH